MTSLTYAHPGGDRVWQYRYGPIDTNTGYPGENLVEVQPPVGPSWGFGYKIRLDSGTHIWEGTLTVATPTQGWVRYTSTGNLDENFLERNRDDEILLKQRETGVGEAVEGIWTYAYLDHGTNQSPPFEDFGMVTTILGPDGYRASHLHARIHIATPGPDSWDALLRRVEVGPAEAPLGVTETTWQAGVSLGQEEYPGWGDHWAFLPTQVTSWRDGRPVPYAQSYAYEADRLNHFGQPSTVTETGDFERTTTYTYRAFTGSTYLADRVESTTVACAGESWVSSSAYADSGFQTGQTIYGISTTFAPDSAGNLASVTDAHNHTTTFTYTRGVPNRIQTPEHTTDQAINPEGTIASITRRGFTTAFEYDVLGRQTRQTPPLGPATVTTYAADGRSVTVTQGNAWTTTSLDAFGRPTETLNSVGVRTRVTYDAWGRVTYASDPWDSTTPERGTTFAYDLLGRVTRRTHADASFVAYAHGWNAAGATVTVTDEEGHQTTRTFHASGSPTAARLVSVTDADGETTSHTYDGLGSLIRVQAPGVWARVWHYNSRHRLDWESQPESGTVSYWYDDAGLLIRRTDAKGDQAQYQYDANDRLVHIVAQDPDSSTTIGYDDSDNRIQVANGYVTTDFTYDGANRLRSRTDLVNGYVFTTTFGVDDRGDVTDVTYPSGNHVAYGYDTEHRVTRVSDTARGLEFASGVTYHPAGGLASYVAGNGLTYSVSYDNRARPERIVSGPVDLTYAYDHVGNVLEITDGRGAGWRQAFSYDVLDRLTSANGVYGFLAFAYDAAGNGILGNDYVYEPETERLLARTAGGVTTTFTYDQNGSLTSQQVGGNATTFSYTPDRMVATVTAGGATATYRYDGDLRRTVKTASGQTIYTIHGAGGQLLSTFVEEAGTLRWERDDLYLGGQLLAALRPVAGALPLTVTTTGTGGGTVTSVPAGIACSPACAAAFAAGTFVTLTASPAPGSRFAGWTGSGACAVPAAETSRTLWLLEATTCTATFAQVLPLTVTKTGAGQSGMVITSVPPGIICAGACTVATGAFDTGTEVQLTASLPPAGFTFVGWTGDGCVSGPGPGEAHVLMDRERACTATAQLVAAKQAPTNGATWLPSEVTLSWSGAAPDVGFWFCVDQTNNNVCDTMWWPNGSATTMGLGWMGLGPGTYYWQVRADTALALVELDEGAWWSFTVGAPEGATFGKTSPATGAGGLGSAVTLTWGALSGAPGYEVCWDTTLNSLCDGTWQATGTTTSWALTNLTPGTYEWQVRAGGTTEADGGTWWTFTVAVQFGKQAPAHEATWLPTNVWVSWTAVPDAGYWVCVDQTNNNVCDTMWWPNGSATARLYEGLAPGTYYWQARAQPEGSGLIEADGGVWWRFTVGAPPGTTFTKLAPANGATLTSGTVTLSWSAATGAPGYEVCWDTTANSTCDATWQAAGPATTLTVNGLPTGMYEWQVRAGGTTQADGGTWWAVTVPVLLNKLAPANGTTGLTSEVTLSWTAVPEAGYWVCFDTVDNGQCDSMWWPNGMATTMGLGWLGLGPGTYVWQVRAQDDQTGAFTDYDSGAWWHFTIGSEPQATPALGGEEGSWQPVPLAPPAAVTTGSRPAGEAIWPEGDQAFEAESPAAPVAMPLAASAAMLLLEGTPPVTVQYYHLDALGSVRAVTDAAGVVLRRHDFLPFGEEWQPPLPSGEPRLFTGQERDAETGLDYFGARYYAGSLGRFTTVDPLMALTSNILDPQRWNRYAYARNNPLRFIDPSGMDANTPLGEDGWDDMTWYLPGWTESPFNYAQRTLSAMGVRWDDLAFEPAGGGLVALVSTDYAKMVPSSVKVAIVLSVILSNAPTADDTRGGNHEEGGLWGRSGSRLVIVHAKPGPYCPPSAQTCGTNLMPADQALANTLKTLDGRWHVHPRNPRWIQRPSPDSDLKYAVAFPAINIVVGARDSQVYFYYVQGIVAQMSLKDFMR